MQDSAAMANQRKPGKRNVGGYMDRAIKTAIAATGNDETTYVELSVVRGLLKDGKITKAKLAELVEQKRLKDTTIAALRKDGII
jgi:hypothetical protein